MEKEQIIELTEEDYEDVLPPTTLAHHLDRVLQAARSGKYDFAPWTPVIGLTGSGKTAIIKDWLKFHHLKNWYISGCRSLSKIEVEYFPDYTGEPSVKIVSGKELEDLFTPKKKEINVIFSSNEIDNVDDQTVIVVDDYDRASKEVRKELYNLIRYHWVSDPRANNEKKIKVLNPLMLIVVIDDGNRDVLNKEERNLFGMV